MKSEGFFAEIEASPPGSVWHLYKQPGKSELLHELGTYLQSKGRLVCVLGSGMKEFPRYVEVKDKIGENMVLLIEDSEKFKLDTSYEIQMYGALSVSTTAFRFKDDTAYYERRGHIVRNVPGEK